MKTGKIKQQHLFQLIYSNNHMGVKSLSNLKELLPFINDLGLNNIKFNGGFIGEKLYGASDILEEIIQTAALTG